MKSVGRKSSKKVYYGITLVVLVLAAFFLGGKFFNKQTSTTPLVQEAVENSVNTSGWVDFPEQNESYDFTFKYDANKYNQWKSSPYDLAWVSKGQDGQDVPDSLTLQCSKEGLQQYSQKTSEKTMTLGNKNVTYYQIEDKQSGDSYAVVDFITGVGNCRFHKNISQVGESEEFDTILSTFRFL